MEVGFLAVVQGMEASREGRDCENQVSKPSHTGRNFECFSEDPHLSAALAAAYIEGVQVGGRCVDCHGRLIKSKPWDSAVRVCQSQLRGWTCPSFHLHYAGFLEIAPQMKREIGRSFTTAYKAEGVACCVKHLVANDQEHRRSYISAEVSEKLAWN